MGASDETTNDDEQCTEQHVYLADVGLKSGHVGPRSDTDHKHGNGQQYLRDQHDGQCFGEERPPVILVDLLGLSIMEGKEEARQHLLLLVTILSLTFIL